MHNLIKKTKWLTINIIYFVTRKKKLYVFYAKAWKWKVAQVTFPADVSYLPTRQQQPKLQNIKLFEWQSLVNQVHNLVPNLILL
jgi:hypothetical protein